MAFISDEQISGITIGALWKLTKDVRVDRDGLHGKFKKGSLVQIVSLPDTDQSATLGYVLRDCDTGLSFEVPDLKEVKLLDSRGLDSWKAKQASKTSKPKKPARHVQASEVIRRDV